MVENSFRSSDIQEQEVKDINNKQLELKQDAIEKHGQELDNLTSIVADEEDNSIDFANMTESQLVDLTSKLAEESYNDLDTPTERIETEKEIKYVKKLDETQKQEVSDTLYEWLKNTPKGQAGNFRVPEPEKLLGAAEVYQKKDGNIVYRFEEAWKPDHDGAKEGTREMFVVKSGTIMDRIGGEKGDFFSFMDENGEPITLIARAIGDRVRDKENIEENDSYVNAR